MPGSKDQALFVYCSMDINKLKQRIVQPNNTVKSAVERGLLSIDQVNKDNYLIEAYYFDSPIYVVTPQVLITEPKMSRGVDIPEYAWDMIVEQGLVLAFVGLTSIKLKRLKEKDFMSISVGARIPYGLERFPLDFKYGTPILIVEGNRDVLVARRYYPYCLAMETASIPSQYKRILSTLTDKLILALDNDEAGQVSTKRLQRFDKEFQYTQFVYPSSYKDFGDIDSLYLSNSFEYEFYDSYIKLQIQSLTGGK